MPFLQAGFDASILGYGVKGRKVSLIDVLKLVAKKQRFVLHCHRNNEMLFALLLRLLGEILNYFLPSMLTMSHQLSPGFF